LLPGASATIAAVGAVVASLKRAFAAAAAHYQDSIVQVVTVLPDIARTAAAISHTVNAMVYSRAAVCAAVESTCTLTPDAAYIDDERFSLPYGDDRRNATRAAKKWENTATGRARCNYRDLLHAERHLE
jgi:hypothetical protein